MYEGVDGAHNTKNESSLVANIARHEDAPVNSESALLTGYVMPMYPTSSSTQGECSLEDVELSWMMASLLLIIGCGEIKRWYKVVSG